MKKEMALTTTDDGAPPTGSLPAECIGGPIGNDFPLAFTDDGGHAFCCCGVDVRVLDAGGGALLRVLKGHTGVVTSAFAAGQTLYTSSLDGTVRSWDFLNGVCLRRYQPGVGDEEGEQVLRVLRAEAPGDAHSRNHGRALLLIALLHSPKKRRWKLLVFDTNSRRPLRTVFESAQNSRCSGVALKTHGWRSGGEVFAISLVAISQKVMRVWGMCVRGNTGHGGREVSVHHRRVYTHNARLTAVALHPLDGTAATGDIAGNIVLWRGAVASFGGERGRELTHRLTHRRPGALRAAGAVGPPQTKAGGAVVTTNLHWHSRQVNCLAFSSGGDALLSGGTEAVLVVWHMSTGAKSFLPRLGAAIRSVASCPTNGRKYAISLADNTILVVCALDNMAALWRLRGLSLLAPVHSTVVPASLYGMCVEPRNGGVVFKTLPGRAELQVVDIENGALMDTIKVPVAGGNPTRLVIEFVAFSCDGLVMATVHAGAARATPERGTARSCAAHTPCSLRLCCSMQLWRYRPGKRRYVLNATINGLHNAPVSALVYHPREHVVVSASLDGTFKVWARYSGARASVQRALGIWRCRFVGCLQQTPIFDASFSRDGSLLAIAHGNATTLWDTRNNANVGTLLNPAEGGQQPTQQIVFLGDSRFLVVRTEKTLYVWNVVAMRVWWAYTTNSHIGALACTSRFGTRVGGVPGSRAASFGAAVVLAVGAGRSGESRGTTLMFFDAATSALPVHTCLFGQAVRSAALCRCRNSCTLALLLLTERRVLVKIDVTHVYRTAMRDSAARAVGHGREQDSLPSSFKIPRRDAIKNRMALPDKHFSAEQFLQGEAMIDGTADTSLSFFYHNVLNNIMHPAWL